MTRQLTFAKLKELWLELIRTLSDNGLAKDDLYQISWPEENNPVFKITAKKSKDVLEEIKKFLQESFPLLLIFTNQNNYLFVNVIRFYSKKFGNIVLSPEETGSMEEAQLLSPANLTDKEKQLLKLFCTGKSVKEAAGIANLSPRTVQNHRENIYKKMRVRGATGMILHAIKFKLVDFSLAYPENNLTAVLTQKEIKHIQLICMEKSTEEIATEFDISPRTVEAHRYRIIDKTATKNITGLLVYAARKGILSESGIELKEAQQTANSIGNFLWEQVNNFIHDNRMGVFQPENKEISVPLNGSGVTLNLSLKIEVVTTV